MEKYNELVAAVSDIEGDIALFNAKGRGWLAAGSRIRKTFMSVKNSAQNIRVDVQEQKNADTEAKKAKKEA
jgi:hypothetical protein